MTNYLRSEDINRFYEKLGVPDRGKLGDLVSPHIDRIYELVCELVERSSSPPQAGCGDHLP
jgi:hypothetical protein